MSSPDIDHLPAIRLFVLAARSASFAAAADQVGMTGSAVGKAVSRLEQKVGARLFQRTTRSLSLTEEGRLLFEACQSGLGQIADAEDQLLSRSVEPAGRVRLNLPEALGRMLIAPVLFGLMERHQKLDYDVSFANRFVDMVDEGIDLAIRIGQLPTGSDIVTRRIGQQRLVVVATPSFLVSHGAPHAVSDLDRTPCIAHQRDEATDRWHFAGSGKEPVRKVIVGRMQTSNFETIVEAVRGGLGLAQIPHWLVAADVQSGRLVTVLDDVAPPPLPISAIWSNRRNMSLKLRVTIDAIAQAFQGF